VEIAIMNLADIKVYVIAIDGEPRNSSLLEQLGSILDNKQVEIVQAITPNQLIQDDLMRISQLGSAILGRHISSVEIAVAQSHMKCYQIAVSRKDLSAFILEDDVDISNTIEIQKILTQYKTSELPTISTLYTPMWGVWKYSLGSYSAVIPPAYACSYLINFNAMQIALENEPIGLADWPVWSEKVFFEFLANNAINQANTESTIEKFRQISINRKKKYIFTFSFKVLHTLGFKTYFLNRIYYPYLWKKYLTNEVKSGNREKNDNRSIFLFE
jgi:hypothetical protein